MVVPTLGRRQAVSAKNIDGTQAIDDKTLRNYSGKAVGSLQQNQKLYVFVQLG